MPNIERRKIIIQNLNELAPIHEQTKNIVEVGLTRVPEKPC